MTGREKGLKLDPGVGKWGGRAGGRADGRVGGGMGHGNVAGAQAHGAFVDVSRHCCQPSMSG